MQATPGLTAAATLQALAGSIVLHALLVLLLWKLPWAQAPVRLPPAPVPIALRTVGAVPELPIADAAPDDEMQAEPTLGESTPGLSGPLEPIPDRQPDDPPATPSTAEPEPQPAEPQRIEPQLAEPQDSDAGDAPIERPSPLPDGIDIEDARRRAIAHVIESLREQSEAHTFSLQDVAGSEPGAPEDPDGDGSELDVFERAAQQASDGIAPAGRQKSRLARSLVDFCHELTGGFSILGMVNVCAEPAARADLFGHLRREYMESVPLCTAEEDLDIEVTQSANGAVGSLKCVLVPREVRAQFYRRYDPALAGWLPAESDTAERAD